MGAWSASFRCCAALALAACQQASPPPATTTGKPEPAAAAAPAPAMKVQPAIVVPRAWSSPRSTFRRGRSISARPPARARSIEYEPRVEKLCRRHPEMGPCQYERESCRAQGGRVYTAEGRGSHDGGRSGIRPRRAPRALPGRRRRAGQEVAGPSSARSSFAAKVLQVRGSPVLMPCLNQRERCSALPWVNASGTT